MSPPRASLDEVLRPFIDAQPALAAPSAPDTQMPHPQPPQRPAPSHPQMAAQQSARRSATPPANWPTGTTAAGAASVLNHCVCRTASRYSTSRPSIIHVRSPWRNAGTLATGQSSTGYSLISSSVFARSRSSSAHAFSSSVAVSGGAASAMPRNSLKIGLS